MRNKLINILRHTSLLILNSVKSPLSTFLKQNLANSWLAKPACLICLGEIGVILTLLVQLKLAYEWVAI